MRALRATDRIEGEVVTESERAQIQVWEESPGHWVTVDERPEADALAVAQTLAATEPNVRVAKDGESLARWLGGMRTIR